MSGAARRALAAALALLFPLSCASPGPRSADPDRPRGPVLGDVDVEFRGNDTLWGFTLRRALSDFKDRPLEPGVIEDAAFALERYYGTRGFPFAKVSAKLGHEEGEVEPVVFFRIEEGARTEIASVRFMGNRRFKTEELEASLVARVYRWYEPHYIVEDELDDDAARLHDRYVVAGYIDARIGRIVSFDAGREAARVIWTIDEGDHYMLEGVEVTGQEAFDEAVLVRQTGLRRGVDFYPRRAVEVRDAIRDYYRDHGYAFAKVEVATEIDRAARTAIVRAHVAENGIWRYGRVGIRGNQVTQDSIIERELKLTPNALFSQQEIRAAEKRLYALGLFERVTTDVEPTPGRPGATDVTFDLLERPAGAVKFGLGYGSFDYVRASLAGSYDNLFGRALRVDARVTGSIRGIDSNVGFRDRALLGTPFRLDIDGYYVNRDVEVFTIERLGGTTFISFPVLPAVRLATGLRLEESTVTNVPTGAIVANNTERIFSGIVRLSRDGRDDPIEPRWGTFHEITYEEAGLFNILDADFSKVGAGAGYYATVGEVTFALGLHAGLIFPQEGKVPPIQERYFLGGDSTLRGFALNQVGQPNGGNAFLLGTIEARYTVYGPFALALFVDAGNVYPTPSRIALGDVQWSPGFGIRAKTPIGPLRLDVGFPVAPPPGNSYAQVWFAVGYPY
jgi:outer membrane protein insertion porin family